MPKANLLTRDLYRQIKSMNRDAKELLDRGALLLMLYPAISGQSR